MVDSEVRAVVVCDVGCVDGVVGGGGGGWSR